jgi:hypothetical protein
MFYKQQKKEEEAAKPKRKFTPITAPSPGTPPQPPSKGGVNILCIDTGWQC